MASYKAPLRDMKFVLDEVFEAPKLWKEMPATEDVDMDVVEQILESGAKLTENELFPLNRSGDEEGCHWKDTVVNTPKGFPEAFAKLAENGWCGLGGNPDYDGQGMPKMLTVLFEEMLYSANAGFALFPALNSGATVLLDAHASEEQKKEYLPRMYEGRWLGTMCLTEPHSGTDLGIIRTKATPNDDGTYTITGNKIWITGGEHDLSENIVHLVLAKLPDAPAGVKGISLFLVPKFFPNSDGSNGDRNQVFCGAIEHKMGIKGSATCVMNFDGAKGYIIGEPNKGLAYMFTMMNYERLSIGIQGLGLGEVAYQSAMDFARERIQSRGPNGAEFPEKEADPILVHPDVRRMALISRAFNEGSRAFTSYVAMQLDISKYHPDEAKRKDAAELVAVLTPVAKAFITDRGLESTIEAQQLYGGNGYCREWGAEQYVRDVRIAQIYEGTNGIQANDLIGRKTIVSKGAYLKHFIADVREFMADCEKEEGMQDWLKSLNDNLNLLQKVTDHILAKAPEDKTLAGSVAADYLYLFGLTAYAYMWAKMVRVALKGDSNDKFYDAKIKVGEFYRQRILPRTLALEAQIEAGSESLMALKLDQFYVE